MNLFLTLWACAGLTVQERQSSLDKFRALEYSPKEENFDRGWKERVALEFEIVNAADVKSLRAALKDPDRYVRSMAARVLGILSDKASGGALADLTQSDPEYLVRARSVEALGLLKIQAGAVERAKKDSSFVVRWSAQMAAGQLQTDTDYAALVRAAYAAGIRPEAMDSAKVGRPAPDFMARTTDGAVFKLSEVLGQKPIVIYFTAFDG